MSQAQDTEVTEEPARGALPADIQDERLIASEGIGGWFRAAFARIRAGDLGSLPVVVGLIVIWIVFQLLNPAFLSSRNLVNLTLQCAAVGTISVGIVLVLLLGEIDLSVGSVAGLSASALTVAFVQHRWPLALALALSVGIGVVIGLFYSLLYTVLGIPSFVITLSGLLGFLGLQLTVLGKTSTINIPYDSALVKFSVTFLPNWLSWVIAAFVVALYLLTRLRLNQLRTKAGLSPTPVFVILLSSAGLAIVLAVVLYALVLDRGVSYLVLFFVALVVVVNYAVKRTRWGRALLAIGGNAEASRRAGINVRGMYVSAFVLCSVLAAVGGILLASRNAAGSTATGGADTNLNAIAAAVIGGTSLFGGRGSAYSALLGIVVLQSINSGLNLLSLSSNVQYVVTGAVLLIAVAVDSLSRRKRAAAGRA